MKSVKFLLVALIASVCSLSWLEAYEYNLSVAAIFRNEAPYLKEWIEYYKLLGVEHFYLYDNLSEDNFHEVLAPYAARREVTLVDWPFESGSLEEWDKIQVGAYKEALQRAKKSSNWLAIVDTDEFIVPVAAKSLTQILSGYESSKKTGGICIPWVFFGTSHVKRIPADKLMIELLVLNGGAAAGGVPGDIWAQGAYKSIVRPKYVKSIDSPHYCTYKSGREHILLDFKQAQINHYWTRDEEFLYNVKIGRRCAWGGDPETVLFYAGKMHHDTPYGKPILKFVAELHKRMGLP